MHDNDKIIQSTRELIDGLIDMYGEAVIQEGDFDRALVAIASGVAESQGTREQLSIAIAFAVRRLWHKRIDVPRFSVN